MQSDFLRRMPGAAAHKTASEHTRSILFRLHIDWILLLLIALLFGFGVVVLSSAGADAPGYLHRQIVFAGIGFCTMVLVAQVPLPFMQRWAWLGYIGGMALLGYVLFAGAGAMGAQRWIDLGFIRFQPSEVIKLSLPLTLAAYLTGRPMPPRFIDVVMALVLAGIPLVMIFLQPDLGTGLLVAASGLVVLFLAGLLWRYLIAAAVLAPIAVLSAWFFVMHDYQKQRVLTMFNPEADKLGAGWNIIQSTTAIGSGGWSGKGWMEGTQSQLNFLPESHTDFIIAVFAEEFGFIGVVLLLGLYLLVVARGLMIAVNAQDSFRRLLAGSITLTFFIYVFVNVGMVGGLLPVVGVPLPLFSLGGTSLVTLMLGFGLLMSISTEQRSMSNK